MQHECMQKPLTCANFLTKYVYEFHARYTNAYITALFAQLMV